MLLFCIHEGGDAVYVFVIQETPFFQSSQIEIKEQKYMILSMSCFEMPPCAFKNFLIKHVMARLCFLLPTPSFGNSRGKN